MDPEYPADRVAFTLNDAGASLLIASSMTPLFAAGDGMYGADGSGSDNGNGDICRGIVEGSLEAMGEVVRQRETGRERDREGIGDCKRRSAGNIL